MTGETAHTNGPYAFSMWMSHPNHPLYLKRGSKGTCTHARASGWEDRTITAETWYEWTSNENRAAEDILSGFTERIRPGLEYTTPASVFHFFPLENWYLWTCSTRWDHPWGFTYICTADVQHVWLHFPQFTILPWNLGPSLPVISSPFIPYLLAENLRLRSISLICYGHDNQFDGDFNSLELKIKHRYAWSASVRGMNT